MICVWPVTSTLHFLSIRIPMVTDSLLVMRTDLYHFSLHKSKSEPTRFLFPLCCTLTAHFSRKESQFDLYTVSIIPHIICYIVYDIDISLVFFNTFEPISLTPESCIQRKGVPMLYKRAASQVPSLYVCPVENVL